MISVTELRAGATFKQEGQPFLVIDYQHTKLGRGNATIKIKAKNLLSGSLVTKTFVSGRFVEAITTETKTLEYLYTQDNLFYFMDPLSFEQYSLSAALIGEKEKYLLPGSKVKVLFWEEKPLDLVLPNFLVLQVKEAPPGERGDTASASFKPAVLENDLVVKVPLFVKTGEKIKVDTRTNSYLARVK